VQKPWVVEAVGGAALGSLVGLLLGLSATSVVGGMITSLAAVMVAFLGLNSSAKTLKSRSGLRTASFSLFCAGALIAGLEARSHNWFGITPSEQVRAWEAAGFGKQEARDLAVFGQLGIVPAGRVAQDPPKASPLSGFLFGTPAADCDALAKERFGSAVNRLDGFLHAGDRWSQVARAARGLPDERAAEILEAAYALACAPGSR